MFGRSLSEVDSLDGGLQSLDTDVMSEGLDNSRVAQDLGLQTDLQVKPTAVDVAMLHSLLKGAGPLLPVLLQTMFGRSLSEVDSLDGGLQSLDTDVMSEGLDNSRVAQDLGLQTDLQVKPTAVDVAMLHSLLKGAGPLLPVLLQTMFGRSLSEVDSLDGGLQSLDTDVMSEGLDNSRVAQDLGLQTDLQVKPTAVDVAMLHSLLKGAGPLLPVLLQTMFGRSLSEVDSLVPETALLQSSGPLNSLFGSLLELDDTAVENEHNVYNAASAVSSTTALLTGPAMTALFSGPIVAPVLAIGKIVAGHPLVATSALLGLIPLIIGPPLKLILAGPALLPALALLKALKLGAFLAAPVVVGVAFAALLLGPAISKILPGILAQSGTIRSLLPVLVPLLLSGPYGPLLSKIGQMLSPLVGPLSAMLTGPAVTSFLALVKALISGATLLPLERGVKALPVKLAAAMAEVEGFPDTSNSSFNAFDILNTGKN